MGDYWLLLAYPGVPILLVTFSPYLTSNNKPDHKILQCFLLFISVMTGPILGGMWGLIGGFVHLASDNCVFMGHSVWWHFVPFILVMTIGWGIIIPLLEKYTGREF